MNRWIGIVVLLCGVVWTAWCLYANEGLAFPVFVIVVGGVLYNEARPARRSEGDQASRSPALKRSHNRVTVILLSAAVAILLFGRLLAPSYMTWAFVTSMLLLAIVFLLSLCRNIQSALRSFKNNSHSE